MNRLQCILGSNWPALGPSEQWHLAWTLPARRTSSHLSGLRCWLCWSGECRALSLNPRWSARVASSCLDPCLRSGTVALKVSRSGWWLSNCRKTRACLFGSRRCLRNSRDSLVVCLETGWNFLTDCCLHSENRCALETRFRQFEKSGVVWWRNASPLRLSLPLWTTST